MDRRAFFRRALHKTGETVVRELDERIAAQARRWIRPPWAQAELEFLLACTRCGDCIQACPHQVVFALPARVGMHFAGTPALDLLNRGCHLCPDWPCGNACTTGALRPPRAGSDEPSAPPPFALARIDPERCLPYQGPECGACEHACPVPGALRWEGPRPQIDTTRCVGCARCREACIVAPSAVIIEAAALERRT